MIVPQAVRAVIPPLTNDILSLVKGTALVSVIGVSDILTDSINAASAAYSYLEAYGGGSHGILGHRNCVRAAEPLCGAENFQKALRHWQAEMRYGIVHYYNRKETGLWQY